MSLGATTGPLVCDNIERLADQLAGRFDVDIEPILLKFSSITSSSSVEEISTVQFSPVSTFIHSAKDNPFAYLVSSVARHWGVIVGDEVKFLYHLVFENQADVPSNTKPESLTEKVRAVKFNCTIWDGSQIQSPSAVEVGKTRYSTNELVKIGCPRIGG